MAAPSAAETATACSRCDRAFSSDGLRLAGSCSTCPDGDALCQNCVERHSTNPRFKGHVCRLLGEIYAGAELLARLNLAPVPTVCPLHGHPFMRVKCGICAGARGLCADCIDEHAVAHPTHALTSFALDVPGLRADLKALLSPVEATSSPSADSAPGDGSSGESATQESFLVGCARRKALAVRAELDALAANVDACEEQLEGNGEAAIAAIRDLVKTGMDSLHAAASTKRAGLQTELAAADAALEAAARTTSALAEVGVVRYVVASLAADSFPISPRASQAAVVLNDSDVAHHAAALSERFTAARAAVAAIPDHPATSAYLAVAPAPDLPVLRTALAGMLDAISVKVGVGCGGFCSGWSHPRK